MKLLRLS